MPRCYMVKKGGQRQQEGPSPSSPSEASVAPCCYSPPTSSTTTSYTGPEVAEYAELRSTPFHERSAADTEAAHELLSLAQSVPPLPPAAPPTLLTVVHEPASILPIYTYTMQPTNILIVSDQSDVYQTMQIADLPIQYVDSIEQAETLEIEVEQTPVSSKGDQPVSESKPTSIPTSVIQHAAKEKVSYDCNECGKRYATSSNLSRHRQTHRSLDSVAAKRCPECGKAYVSMPALAMHILTHRMGHVCGICGKQFSRPWLLRGHLRSHTGEKPYRCARCGKPFADRSNLRAHYQTHLHDKKYECKRCRKTFALKSYLNKHQESTCTRDT